jgi:ABC-type uncharacterized transport system substrate-binding protein
MFQAPWKDLMRPFKLIVMFPTVFFLICSNLTAYEKDKFSTSPVLNNGKKWRIAYYEGGQFDNYHDYFLATLNGLMDLGWIEKTDIPDHNKNAKALWDWASKNAKSDYIEFPNDGFYSADWVNQVRETLKENLIARLNEKKDIDLVLAMGSWAGRDLANDRHSTPTYILSTSDAINTGIIKSAEDSGYDHINARIDPLRYERQVRLFHDIIGFKSLGVAYEDSVYGKNYAALDHIEKVAQERGFDVVKCFTQSDIPDQDKADESVLKCYEDLARKVDAIYVTVQRGVNPKTIPQLVRIANENRIPTFSQADSKGVKSGFLLSISRGGFKPVGLFQAATIAKIFNGAKPRQLNQVYEEARRIAINLKTAGIVGVYLHSDVLAAADEIYRDIENPE